MGNMMQEHIFEIWTNKIMSKFRKNLLCGKRVDGPCTSCNAGTILGKKYVKYRERIYNISNN